MAESLDSVLEKALVDSGASTANEALVVALHACLLAGEFDCIAVGDENFGDEHSRSTPSLSSSSSPGLPRDWNQSRDVYSIQYRHRKSRQPCLVKTIPLGDQLLINALASNKTDTVYSVTVDVSKFIRNPTDASFNSPSAFINLLQLVTTLNRDIESKLAECCGQSLSERTSTKSTREKTRKEDEGEDPLRVTHPSHPTRGPHPLAEMGPFGVGDGDRLPFGGGGGGMIFDPLRQGGRRGGGGLPGPAPMGPFPPGHPPGARFDPVGPGFGQRQRPDRYPGRGGIYDPDPDHLPPPGYDDMFS